MSESFETMDLEETKFLTNMGIEKLYNENFDMKYCNHSPIDLHSLYQIKKLLSFYLFFIVPLWDNKGTALKSIKRMPLQMFTFS